MAQPNENIKYEEEFIVNSRGLKQFTCRWFPTNREPKALIFLCHGYGIECSISMKGTAMQLANAGFAVHGMDYVGHGKSSGLRGYVPNFHDLVQDCSEHFTKICEMKENKMRKRFLLGESMGGAVVLLLHRKKPTFWDGAVLVAPMCKIADEMKPHPIIIKIFTKLGRIIPKWKIIPTKDIIDSAIKNPEVREKVRSNPYCYKGKPRLRTGQQLLMVSLDIEKNLNQVSLPFIIVHGGADTVTDPLVSQALFEASSSKDKTFKLYPEMWHALTAGEPKENIDLVFRDIIGWLEDRSVPTTNLMASPTEMEHKMVHDTKIVVP